MKFRLSVQPTKPKEFKSIAPSHLLSDPAFSADPHSNPYFVNNPTWVSSPPVGHPVLKSKNTRPVAKFATDNSIIASADFDFQLLQPPNSPVSFLGGSGTPDSPRFPLPSPLNNPSSTPASKTAAPSPSTTASSSLGPRTVTVAASTASSVTLQPPALKEEKKKRMPFLSRRKPSQPAVPNASLTALKSPKSKASPLPTSYDVTQSARPAAPRMASEPVVIQSNAKRPAFPPRHATTGADTPSSTAASSSTASKRLGEGLSSRNQDLDRIDELDETNPWGISLHHGGPYEAAVQALRRGENRMPLGFSNGGINDYHKQAMHAHGHAYVPPQAPIGVSLNLSPGQILPRNFAEQHGNYPRTRDASALPPRMQLPNPHPQPSLYRSRTHAVPPQVASSPPQSIIQMEPATDVRLDSSRYRRQSQPVPASSAFSSPFPNPHPVIGIEPRPNPQPDLTFSRRQSGAFPVSSQLPTQLPNPHPVVGIEPKPNPRPDLTFSRRQSQAFPVPPNLQPGPPSITSPEPRPSLQLDTHISRRQSQTLPRSFTVSNSVPLSAIRAESRDLPSNSRPEAEADDDMSFNIGMAMLQPKEASESSSISAPRIFLPPGTPDHEKEFDPYDPIHLEKGHSRTPSPLVVAYAASPESSREPSRAPSREPSRELSPLRVTNPEPTTSAQKPERTNNRDRQAPPTQQGTRIDDPPPYNNTILIEDERLPTSHFRAPPQTQTSSRSTSPERAPSRKSNDVASSDQSHQSRQGSVTMPTDSMRDIPTMAQNKREVSDSRQPRPALVSTQNNSVEKVQPMAHDQRSVAQDKQAVAPMLPARRSRERLPPPTLSSSERDRDARSTHQSISTHSSGQTRNGPPPPHRRVPKHLVMPAPLNNGGGLNGFASPPPRMYPLPSGQLPPRHAQVTFQPQMQTYYPRPVSPPGFKPPILATQQAQEIHIATSRKLKKRMSMVTPSSVANIPPAPIISTVSFAPPVIGYGHHPSDEKGLSRAKTEKIEKIPKRVLSKRRTNI